MTKLILSLVILFSSFVVNAQAPVDPGGATVRITGDNTEDGVGSLGGVVCPYSTTASVGYDCESNGCLTSDMSSKSGAGTDRVQ
jgi:hypothetical protein